MTFIFTVERSFSIYCENIWFDDLKRRYTENGQSSTFDQLSWTDFLRKFGYLKKNLSHLLEVREGPAWLLMRVPVLYFSLSLLERVYSLLDLTFISNLYLGCNASYCDTKTIILFHTFTEALTLLYPTRLFNYSLRIYLSQPLALYRPRAFVDLETTSLVKR